MKKTLLIFSAALLAFASCKKENPPAPKGNTGGNNNPPQQEIVVPQKNMALINKVTGSECFPCGTWGWLGLEALMDRNGNNAIYMGTYSDNFVAQLFVNQTATDMDRAWEVTSYPTFVANGIPQLDRASGSVNIEGELDKVDAAVDAHLNKEVLVNSGFRTSIKDNVMTIETKTKFFKEANSDMYLAVYLMEDKVKGFQSGHADAENTLHHHVLRGAAKLDGQTQAQTWGYPLSSGITPVGTTIDKKFTIDVTGYNQANLEVAVVVWRKVANRYFFVNASGTGK